MELKRLKPVVNTESWDIFKEYLDTLIDIHHKNLINADNRDLIYRSQGAMRVLQDLQNLRDKVNAG